MGFWTNKATEYGDKALDARIAANEAERAGNDSLAAVKRAEAEVYDVGRKEAVIHARNGRRGR